MLQQHGVLAAQSMSRAQALLMRQVQQQSAMLSYVDAFWILAVSAACMIPLVFLMKDKNPKDSAPAGH
jgi:hypothetical protein